MEWDCWTCPYDILALKKNAMMEYKLRWKLDEIWNKKEIWNYEH